MKSFIPQETEHWFKTYDRATYVNLGAGDTERELRYTQRRHAGMQTTWAFLAVFCLSACFTSAQTTKSLPRMEAAVATALNAFPRNWIPPFTRPL